MAEFSGVKKILVIKLRHIGDVLLTVPVFRALRETFPGAHISALVNAGTQETLAGNPLVDEIIIFDRRIKTEAILKKLSGETSFLAGIRAKGFDMAVDLTSGDRAALISLVSGARYRIAYDPEREGFPGKRFLYTHIAARTFPPPHMVIQNLEMIGQFGITTSNLAVDIYIPPDAEGFVDKAFQEHSICCGRDTIVHIHPTSRWFFKLWKDEYMAEVIDWLVGNNARVIITSSPSEKEIIRTKSVLDNVKDRTTVVDLSGKTTIKQLAAVSSRSNLFIGVDSAPMHIAAAVGVPVIALFGPTGEKQWGPWGSGHTIFKKHLGCVTCKQCERDRLAVRRCLEAIKPAEVIEAISKILSRQAGQHANAGRDID
jgi:heptosyltransferase III